MEQRIYQRLLSSYVSTVSSDRALEALENTLVQGKVIRADSSMGQAENLKTSLNERLVSNSDEIDNNSALGAFSITYFNMKNDYEKASQKLNRALKRYLIVVLLLASIGILFSLLRSSMYLLPILLILAFLLSVISYVVYNKETNRLLVLWKDINTLQFYRAQMEMLELLPDESNKMECLQILLKGMSESRANNAIINNNAAVKNQFNITENLGDIGSFRN